MSNLLKVAMIETIQSLRQRGWSKRRIARELGIDRETVASPPATAGADKTSQCAPRLPGGKEWGFVTLRRGGFK